MSFRHPRVAGDKKPPPLMDPTRERDTGRILALFKPYRLRLAVVLVLIVISAGVSMLNPFLLRDALDNGLLKHNDTLLTVLVLGMIGIALFRPRDERVADLHVERRRSARDARPAGSGLPPPPTDVAGLLHADARGRGAVADRQRHRGARQRGHDHGEPT